VELKQVVVRRSAVKYRTWFKAITLSSVMRHCPDIDYSSCGVKKKLATLVIYPGISALYYSSEINLSLTFKCRYSLLKKKVRFFFYVYERISYVHQYCIFQLENI